MKKESQHYPTDRGDGKAWRSSCQTQKKNQKFPCQSKDECFIDDIETLLKLSLDRWYHEIGGDEYPCVCDRRFGSPVDATYHFSWAPEDPTSRDHRCRGTHEPVTYFLSGLNPTAFSITDGKPNSNGFYTLKFNELTTDSTKTGLISATLPVNTEAMVWIDRNYVIGKGKNWFEERISQIKKKAHLILSTLDMERDVIVCRQCYQSSYMFPAVYFAPALVHHVNAIDIDETSTKNKRTVHGVVLQNWWTTRCCSNCHRQEDVCMHWRWHEMCTRANGIFCRSMQRKPILFLPRLVVARGIHHDTRCDWCAVRTRMENSMRRREPLGCMGRRRRCNHCASGKRGHCPGYVGTEQQHIRQSRIPVIKNKTRQQGSASEWEVWNERQ